MIGEALDNHIRFQFHIFFIQILHILGIKSITSGLNRNLQVPKHTPRKQVLDRKQYHISSLFNPHREYYL